MKGNICVIWFFANAFKSSGFKSHLGLEMENGKTYYFTITSEGNEHSHQISNKDIKAFEQTSNKVCKDLLAGINGFAKLSKVSHIRFVNEKVLRRKTNPYVSRATGKVSEAAESEYLYRILDTILVSEGIL